MRNLKVLNARESKSIYSLLRDQWGFDKRLDYCFLQHDDGRLFVANRDLAVMDTRNLRVNSIGLYFGEIVRGEIRLSIEGSQIVGPFADRNVVVLEKKYADSWMLGEDIETDRDDVAGFVILKANEDYLGCGRCKDGKILNFIPKTRRVHAIH